ncbi:MAG: hypothetical protein WCX81_06125, partial [Monoglobales bacterium]
MFFAKSKSEKLDLNLYKNPTSEYRGAPMLSFNTKLTKEGLLKHIEAYEKMGLGGFDMHTRVGLSTDYLGEEFMEMARFCVETAKEKGMHAWLYDEDRWPSGTAGGKVTKEKRYRQRHLNFSVERLEYTKDREEFEINGTPLLLACYDICLDDEKFLKSYEMIDDNAEAKGRKWYAYAMMGIDRIW